MKKGIQLYRVEIGADGHMTCYGISKSGKECVIPLTRTQRHLIRDYEDESFRENVISEFAYPNIFHPDFKIIKNGKVVYQ